MDKYCRCTTYLYKLKKSFKKEKEGQERQEVSAEEISLRYNKPGEESLTDLGLNSSGCRQCSSHLQVRGQSIAVSVRVGTGDKQSVNEVLFTGASSPCSRHEPTPFTLTGVTGSPFC